MPTSSCWCSIQDLDISPGIKVKRALQYNCVCKSCCAASQYGREREREDLLLFWRWPDVILFFHFTFLRRAFDCFLSFHYFSLKVFVAQIKLCTLQKGKSQNVIGRRSYACFVVIGMLTFFIFTYAWFLTFVSFLLCPIFSPAMNVLCSFHSFRVRTRSVLFVTDQR